MIKRSALTGLLLGAILALVMIYPLLATNLEPDILQVRRQGTVHVLLLVLSGAASLASLVLIGSLAAWRSQVISAGQGFLAGAISGFFGGLMFYLLLYAPTAALAEPVAPGARHASGLGVQEMKGHLG